MMQNVKMYGNVNASDSFVRFVKKSQPVFQKPGGVSFQLRVFLFDDPRLP